MKNLKVVGILHLRDVALKRRKIVIIGGNVGGLTAAANAREVDKHAEIVVLSKERHPPYRSSALTSLIATKTSRLEDLSMFSQRLNELKIRFLQGVEAFDIDSNERVVKARCIDANGSLSFHYDSVVLATGSSSFIPPIEGVERKGVFGFRTFKDALSISREARAGKSAVIVGGGFVGLEVAEALTKHGVKVTIAVRSRILREFVEPSLSMYLKERIERRGIKVMTGVSPKEIEGNKKVKCVKLDSEEIPAYIVVFATGVKPNIALAKKIGIELGKTGAIKVDPYMQTSIPEIYAAGDCTETLDALTGEWTYFPVGSVAANEGAITGRNAAGDRIAMKGVIRAQIDMVFGQGIVSIGHGSESARKMGVKVDMVDLSSMQHRFRFLHEYPAKIITAVNSKGQMMGAQVLSSRFAPLYAFTLFLAIQEHMTLEDFLDRWQHSLAAFTDLSMKRVLRKMI